MLDICKVVLGALLPWQRGAARKTALRLPEAAGMSLTVQTP
jgi:hypothetical protein